MNSFVEDNWDKMAKAYEDFTEAEDSYSYKIEWPCIKKLMPELKDKNVLDLGCGTGRFTFLLEESAPKTIVGIDLSQEMLNIADKKAKDKKSNIKFIKGDISKLHEKLSDKYDFVFSSTTTHFISDLNKLFSQMYSVMNKGGSAVISAIHPIYSAQYPIKRNDNFPKDEDWIVRYLDKNIRSYIQPWIEYNDDIKDFLTESYHHTLSDYTNAMLKAGFSIEAIEEPYPPQEWKKDSISRYNGYMETPVYIIFKIKK